MFSTVGPLIALSKVNCLRILKDLFQEIVIPKSVWVEIVEKGRRKPGSEEIAKADWIKVKEPSDKLAVQVLTKELGIGEAETIVLAKEIGAGLVIMDDEIARENAKRLGLKVVGTIALLVYSWRKGILTKNPVEIALEMRSKGAWLANELIQKLKEETRRNGLRKEDC